MAAMCVRTVLMFLWCLCCWDVISVAAAAVDHTPTECRQQKMDIVFLQDASYSVSPHSFQLAKLFLADLVRQLPHIGLDLVRVALVRFGTYADVIARLSQSVDVRAVMEAIEGMTYKVGSTQTGRALKTVREEVLVERRADARAIVVVITDGNSNRFRETRTETRKLRESQVRLVWLYITANDSNIRAVGREREYMAAEGDTTLGADSFEALDSEARMQILNASCKEDPKPETSAADMTISTEPATSSSPSHDVEATSPTHDASSVEDDVTKGLTTDMASTLKPLTEAPVHLVLTEASSKRFSSFSSDISYVEPSSLETSSASSDVTSQQSTTAKKNTGTTSSSSAPHVTSQEPSQAGTTEVTKGEKEEEEEEEKSEGQEDSDITSDHKPSQKGASRRQDEQEESFVDSVEKMVGVTVGGFAVAAALTAGCVYYAVWRRRREEERKQKPDT